MPNREEEFGGTHFTWYTDNKYPLAKDRTSLGYCQLKCIGFLICVEMLNRTERNLNFQDATIQAVLAVNKSNVKKIQPTRTYLLYKT